MTESQTLLADYVANGSEPAFRELVSRYLNLVYSTALRLVDGDTHRAEDVVQTVFGDLARLAKTLSPEVMLGGWLHRRTCHVAASLMRSERRRRKRESQVAEMNALQNKPETSFEELAPVLDEAINELSAPDRAAIVLRYFEERDLRAVGEVLKTNEDAAQKRVTRALEKLRVLLVRRGVALSGVGLATLLSAHAVSAAPAGLAAMVAAAAMAGSAAAGGGLTLSLLKLMTMTQFKAAVGAVVAAGLGTTLLVEHRVQAQLRQDQQALRQEAAQFQRLSAENQRLSSLATQDSNRESPEQELSRLRAEAMELAEQQKQWTNSSPERLSQNRQPPAKDYRPKESCSHAGFAEPDATLETLMWAGANRETNAILNCFPPEMFETELKTKAQQERVAEVVTRCISRWSGYRILNRQSFAEDRMVVTILYETAEGGNVVGRTKLRRVGSDWKFDGELSAGAPLKPGTITWGDGAVK